MICTSTLKKDKLVSLSELKLHIQSIIKNIDALEKLQNEQPTIGVSEEKHNLINDTNTLFSVLEEQTKNQKILRKIKNRRKKRRCQKHKKKHARKLTTLKAISHEQPEVHSLEAPNCKTDTTHDTTRADTAGSVKSPDVSAIVATEIFQETKNENEFLQLKNYSNAQRFLRTFELLEMLHYARSQDKVLTLQFHEQFANLRSVWNNILMENKPKRTAACRIEDQWNEAFFGVKEQTYYVAANKKSERERLREFLRIRRTWDSYLVRQKKHGSCIPTGWVLPKADANELWAKYRTQ